MVYSEYEELEPEWDVTCCTCGFALHKNEIVGEILGTFVDYFERIPNGEIRICYCQECWEKLKAIISDDIRAGIAKRRAMENQDKYDNSMKEGNIDKEDELT